jgi:hypothetical protein
LKWSALRLCHFTCRETATRKPVNWHAGWTGAGAVVGYGDEEKNLEIELDKAFI